MSAVTAPRRLPLTTVAADIGVVTRRNLLKLARLPQLVVFSTIQPIMFVLLFNYVFGGALQIPGVTNYIDFLLPGIFIQTATFGATQTGIALNEDLNSGIIDRFRSLPMARSAVLAGRTLADAVRTVFVIALMVAVGHLIGFRFHAGVPAALGAIALAVGFGFAFSWISANIGLRAGSAEAAQAAGFIWVFPLVFASSAFVPTTSMPGWLQAFANNQPVTAVVNALRVLTLGGDAPPVAALPSTPAATVLIAVAWILGLLAVFVPLAVRRYRQVV